MYRYVFQLASKLTCHSHLPRMQSTQQPPCHPQHPSPPAPATEHNLQPQGILNFYCWRLPFVPAPHDFNANHAPGSPPQAPGPRASSTLSPRQLAHQRQYHNLAHSQQRQLQQAQLQAADLKQMGHQRPNNTRRLHQTARSKARQPEQANAGRQSMSPPGPAETMPCEEALHVPLMQPTPDDAGRMSVNPGDGSMHPMVRAQNTICSQSPMQGNLHLLRKPLPYGKVRPNATDRNPADGRNKSNVAAEMRAQFQQRHDGLQATPRRTGQARPNPRQSTQTRGHHGTIKNGIFTPAEEQPLRSEQPKQLLGPNTLSGGIPPVPRNATSNEARTQGNNINVPENHPIFPTWLPAFNQVPNAAATQEHVYQHPQSRVHGRTQHLPVTPRGNLAQATPCQPSVGANESSKPYTQINPHILKPAPYSREGTAEQLLPRPKLPNAKFQSANSSIEPGGRSSVMSTRSASNGFMMPDADHRLSQSARASVHQAVAQPTPAHAQPSTRRVHASQPNPQLAQSSVRPKPFPHGAVQPSAVHPMETRPVRISDSADRPQQPQQEQHRPPTKSNGLPRGSQPLTGGSPPPLMFPKGPKSNLGAHPGPDALRMPPPSRHRGIPATCPPSPLDAFVFPRICRADDVQTQPLNLNSSYPRTTRIMGKLGSKVLQDLEARPLMRGNRTHRPEVFTGNARLQAPGGQNAAMLQSIKLANTEGPKITPPSWMGPRPTPETNAQGPPRSPPTLRTPQTQHHFSAMSKIASLRPIMNPQPGNAAGQRSPQAHPSGVMAATKTTPTHGEPSHTTPIGKTSLVNAPPNPSPHPQSTTSGTVASKSPQYQQVTTPSAPGITITPAAIYAHPFEQSYVKTVSAALRSEQCNMTRLNIMADAILAFEKLQALNSWVVREQRLQQFRLEYIKSLDKFTMLLQPTIEADEAAKSEFVPV